MRSLGATFSILRHCIAAAVSIAWLAAIPIVLYFGLAIISNDLGGPLNLVLIPLLSIAFGAGVTCIIYFPFAALFQYLARKRAIPVWLPLFMFPALSFMFFLLWGTLATERPSLIGLMGIAALFTAFFTSGFAAYWLMLVLGVAIQKRFERDNGVA